MLKKYWKFILPILIGLLLLAIPAPGGLSEGAWIYFAIFMVVVVGLVLEPIPGALIGLMGVGVLVWLKLGPVGSTDPSSNISASAAIKWGLAGFSNSTVWLIFAAFMLGLGYEKSGLGRRIALFLVKTLGRKTLGLGYAIAIADGILAPFIPSNSARSGGIIYPIVSSLPPMLGSYPDNGARKIGGYLVWVSLAATCVTSSMFFTGLAPNLLAMETAVKSGFSGISWMGWFISFAPCGILLFILTPLLAYYIYPPEIKGSKEASSWASDELKKMGKMQIKEYLMISLAVFALVFWIGGSSFGVDSTTVALSVMIGMVLLGIIEWNDIVPYYQIADAFLNASTTETQGLTYIEALACGTPLIVKYDEVLDDIVKVGENGFYFNNDEELTNLLLKFTNDDLELSKLKDTTFKSIAKYDEDNFAKSIYNVYIDTIKKYKERKQHFFTKI